MTEDYRREQLIHGRHGLTLDDVRGSIRRGTSYWAIDESGTYSRAESEDGRTLTISAVTMLDAVDLKGLFAGIPLYDWEIHFAPLRNEHPDIAIRLMTDLGNENILIVSKTVEKKWNRYTGTRRKERRREVQRLKQSGIEKPEVPSINELYITGLLSDILDVIQEIDLSDTVAVNYDLNADFSDDACQMLWSPRCVLVMSESDKILLLQVADLTASSLGHAVLPDDYGNASYFEPIEKKSMNDVVNPNSPKSEFIQTSKDTSGTSCPQTHHPDVSIDQSENRYKKSLGLRKTFGRRRRVNCYRNRGWVGAPLIAFRNTLDGKGRRWQWKWRERSGYQRCLCWRP